MSKQQSALALNRVGSDDHIALRGIMWGDMGTTVTLLGPVNMVIDRIKIEPSDESHACAVSLEYRQTNEYHAHTASTVLLSPENERLLVEWLHRVGARFVISTDEWWSDNFTQGHYRGECATCGEYFTSGHQWSIHERRDDAVDLYYCDRECFEA